MPVGPIIDGVLVVAGLGLTVAANASAGEDTAAVITLPITGVFAVSAVYGLVKYIVCTSSTDPPKPQPSN